MTAPSLHRMTLLLCLVLSFTWCSLALAEKVASPPVWWAQAEATARKNGYHLISFPELKSLYASKAHFVLLDARPDYEFHAGHLPGAVNIEFHLGDRLKLDSGKAEALHRLLGEDKERLIVVYCRSFR